MRMYLYFPQKVPQNIGQMPAMRWGMEETRSGSETQISRGICFPSLIIKVNLLQLRGKLHVQSGFKGAIDDKDKKSLAPGWQQQLQTTWPSIVAVSDLKWSNSLVLITFNVWVAVFWSSGLLANESTLDSSVRTNSSTCEPSLCFGPQK